MKAISALFMLFVSFSGPVSFAAQANAGEGEVTPLGELSIAQRYQLTSRHSGSDHRRHPQYEPDA